LPKLCFFRITKFIRVLRDEVSMIVRKYFEQDREDTGVVEKEASSATITTVTSMESTPVPQIQGIAEILYFLHCQVVLKCYLIVLTSDHVA